MNIVESGKNFAHKKVLGVSVGVLIAVILAYQVGKRYGS